MTMPDAPVFVVAHINHDRVWHLDGPFLPGQRLTWAARQLRIGGGGYFTGSRLIAAGRRVELVSHLSRDTRGREVAARLEREGFSLAHVTRSEAPGTLTEILLSPDGERTIIGPGHAPPVFDLPHPPARAPAAAYVNARRLAPLVTDLLRTTPLVLTQLPLGSSDPRPADLAVTSRADFPGAAPENIHERARQICGERLSGVVITDGPGPVLVLTDAGTCEVAPERRLLLSDTIGAGDSFAAFLLHELMNTGDLVGSVAAASRHMLAWLDPGSRIEALT